MTVGSHVSVVDEVVAKSRILGAKELGSVEMSVVTRQ